VKVNSYLANNPRDPQMRFLKGTLQTSEGKASDATATFTALTREFPELPEPYNNLAALYAEAGEYDKARNALEMAIRLNPDYAIAYENLGDVQARLAGEAYAKSQRLEPSNPRLAPKLALIRQLFIAPPVKRKDVGAASAATPDTGTPVR
jgi:Flp pilus assembly protein TadD